MPHPNEKSMLKVKTIRLQPGDILDVTLPNGVESDRFEDIHRCLSELQSEHHKGFMFFIHEEDVQLSNLPVEEIKKMWEQVQRRQNESSGEN